MNFSKAMKDVADGYYVKRKKKRGSVGLVVSETNDKKENYVGVFKSAVESKSHKRYVITEEDLKATDWIADEGDEYTKFVRGEK